MCKLTYTDGRLLHVSVIIFGVRGTHNNDALSTNGEEFKNGTNYVGEIRCRYSESSSRRPCLLQVTIVYLVGQQERCFAGLSCCHVVISSDQLAMTRRFAIS